MDRFIWNINRTLEKKVRTKLICSDESLSTLSDWETIDRIFLLLELNWQQRNRASFYGFEILENLRLQNILAPIFVCSSLPLNKLIQIDKRAAILKTPGHYFIQLPAKIWQFSSPQQAIKLTENLLTDINYHFFNHQGRLDELFHNLKDKVTQAPEKEVSFSFQQIAQLIPKENRSELEVIKANLLLTLQKNTDTPPLNIIANAKNAVIALLPQKDESINSVQQIIGWKVLCIDDNLSTLDKLKSQFMDRGIQTICASSGEEAFRFLEKDSQGQLESDLSSDCLPPNTITVVVCDLRFVHKDGTWQNWQGWDIIDHIYNQLKNLVVFFVLTSKKGALIRSIRTRKKVNILMFAKEDVLDYSSEGAFNLFANRVKEEGKRILDSICNVPSGKYWTTIWRAKIKYPLNLYYRYHRMSSTYLEKEKWIATSALEFIQEAEMVKDPFFKNKMQIGDLDFSFAFQSGQSAKPPDAKSMNNFYTKLIGRRIAIGLFLKGWTNDEISEILKFQRLDNYSVDRQLFTSYLALSTKIEKDIPTALLVEERHWVITELGIALDSPNKLFYDQLILALDSLRKKLYDKGCGDDFVEFISIGNQEQAYSTLQKAWQLSKEFELEHLFYKNLNRFASSEKFAHEIKQNNLTTFFNKMD